MKGQVIESGVLSDLFGISNGTKQGCMRASTFLHLIRHDATGSLKGL